VIHRVGLRRFKRFGDVEFVLPGHVVLAGLNNTGKTTVLQAIAAWSLALSRWRELNDFQRHRGYYAKAPIARQAFSAVPLRPSISSGESETMRGASRSRSRAPSLAGRSPWS
jgi:recombinational DNA repair ATPase RecF